LSSRPFCAVVPAAGVGARMGADRPKQYLPLAGATVIEWALAPLLAHPGLDRVAIALAPGDTWFRQLGTALDPRVRLTEGGATRAASVRAGLACLGAEDDIPILVHDSARPCLGADAVERLLPHAADPAGALLAIPVPDTLKRAAADGRVAATVNRAGLWQAQTPQGFPAAVLATALDAAGDDTTITDEASAVERLGRAPRLVEGDPANIKVTRAADLPLAEAILGAARRTRAGT